MISLMILSLMMFVEDHEAQTWEVLTRDIYVNGVLDREARLYRNSKPNAYALTIPGNDRVAVVRGDDLTVTLVPSNAFDFAQHRLKLISSDLPEGDKGARAVNCGNSQTLVTFDSNVVLIGRHMGRSGVMTPGEIWEMVPHWQDLSQDYVPSPDAVKQLAALDQTVELSVYFGTWCGDSRREITRLLAILEAADNPHIKLDLVAIDGDFREPRALIRDHAITNVPTLIVSRSGEETGRMVEHCRMPTLEEELIWLLQHQTPPVHENTEDLTATGAFDHKNLAGLITAREQWTLRQNEGGARIESRVTTETCTWDLRYYTHADGTPSFLELTRRSGATVARARYSFGEGQIAATIRGGMTGIIKQKLGWRGDLLLQTPSAMINGWAAGQHTGQAVDCLVFEGMTGRLESSPPLQEGTTTLQLPWGRTTATRFNCGSNAWLSDTTDGLPLAVRYARGEAVSVHLQRWEAPGS